MYHVSTKQDCSQSHAQLSEHPTSFPLVVMLLTIARPSTARSSMAHTTNSTQYDSLFGSPFHERQLVNMLAA